MFATGFATAALLAVLHLTNGQVIGRPGRPSAMCSTQARLLQNELRLTLNQARTEITTVETSIKTSETTAQTAIGTQLNALRTRTSGAKGSCKTTLDLSLAGVNTLAASSCYPTLTLNNLNLQSEELNLLRRDASSLCNMCSMQYPLPSQAAEKEACATTNIDASRTQGANLASQISTGALDIVTEHTACAQTAEQEQLQTIASAGSDFDACTAAAAAPAPQPEPEPVPEPQPEPEGETVA